MVLARRPGHAASTTFARAAGLHPDLVRRLVALGLARRCQRTPAASSGSHRQQLRRQSARIQRLRAGLALNYAAIGLVLDLLDRIEELEAALASPERRTVTVDLEPADAEVTGSAARRADHRARDSGTPRSTASTCCWRCSTSPRVWCRGCWIRRAPTPRPLRADLEAELHRRPKVSGPGAAPGQVSVTQRLARLLDAAEREAKRLKDDYVSVEHLRPRAARRGLGDAPPAGCWPRTASPGTRSSAR